MTAKLIPLQDWNEARYDPPLDRRTVLKMAKGGHIPGAEFLNNRWRVPADAVYVANPAPAAPAGSLLEFIYGRQTQTA